jgi:hypothetical protein
LLIYPHTSITEKAEDLVLVVEKPQGEDIKGKVNVALCQELVLKEDRLLSTSGYQNMASKMCK